MSSATDTIIEYLREAHSAEQAGLAMLSGHLRGTPPGPYRTLLTEHVEETRRHVARIEDRLNDLGAGSNPLSAGLTLLEKLAGQLVGTALAPVNFLVSRSNADAVLRDAQDQLAAEGREIATYRGLEGLARAGGDGATAALAAAIGAEEQRAYDRLSELLPGLVARVARERFGSVEPRPVPDPAPEPGPEEPAPDPAPPLPDPAARARDEADDRDDDEAAEADEPARSSNGNGTAGVKAGNSFVKSADGPTRGQAAALREAEREAETTEDSPGPEIHVDEPWEGYAKMTAAQVVDRLKGADPTVAAMVRLYEQQNKGRKSVLHATEG